MMKMLIMMSLTILSSCKTIYCNTTPKIRPVERCTISFKFNKCRCMQYDLMIMERIGEAYDVPVAYCDDLTGFKFDDFATIIKPWANESRRAYEDYCVKK